MREQNNFIKTHKNRFQIHVFAFGNPNVLVSEAPVRWRITRSMELFFFLLNYNYPVCKDQLIELLWPHVDNNIDQVLRTSVHFLRQAIGSECVIRKANAYSLDLTSLYQDQFWYDVIAFEQLYSKAGKSLETKDDTRAQEYLLNMLSLYQGDYMQPLYSNWCTSQRDRLRHLYMDANRKLAQIAWHHRQFEKSINFWQNILSIDNCQEDAHHGIIQCYLEQGKRGMALRQYQQCTHTLKEELGVMPGIDLRRLYKQLNE